MIPVGVIGCGYWGPNLLRNLVHHPGAEVRLVAEASAERRAFVERTHPGVSTCEDHTALLADDAIAAVVVATPAATHGALTRAALEAGKHVLVEKPLAMTVAEAEGLVELAAKRDLRLMVGHTFLFNAAVDALKGYVDDGTLGEVYYVYGQRLNLGIVRRDVNALWNLAPHDVSVLIHLLGALPEVVSATGAAYLQRGVEDVVFASLRFPGGAVGHLHVSWLDPGKVRRMTVVGSKKMVVYDDVAEAKLALYDKGIDRRALPPGGAAMDQPQGFGQHQLTTRAGDILLPHVKFTEPLAREVDHFLQCVDTGARPRTDGEAGLAVVRVLEAAQRSLSSGGAEVTI